MKWLLRSDVPSNKITPLYLPKQRVFPRSGRGLRHGQRQVRERQFFLQERFPDTLLQTGRAAISLKTRNYFSNKLSGTLEAWLWWCAGARCHWKVSPIKLEQQKKKKLGPIAFQWVRSRLKCSHEHLYFAAKRTVDSRLTTTSLLKIG